MPGVCVRLRGLPVPLTCTAYVRISTAKAVKGCHARDVYQMCHTLALEFVINH